MSQQKPLATKGWLSSILQAAGLAMVFIDGAAQLSPVPYISPAVTLLTAIIEVAQAVHDNKVAFKALADEATGLLSILCQSRGSCDDLSCWPLPELEDIVQETISVLADTSTFALKQKARKPWSRVLKSKVDPGEIQEYRNKIQAVMTKFKLISHLEINRKLAQMISKDVADDLIAQEKAFDSRRNQVLKTLALNIHPGATYDSFARQDVPRILPDTREDVMDTVKQWFEDSQNHPPILWMHGPVGYGKTTIGQSICHVAADSGHLGASFFWSKSDIINRPTTHDQFVATIAYQLCQLVRSHFTGHIVEAVESNPAIFSGNLAKQMEYLSLLLLTDGIDECEGSESQKLVLDVLLDAVCKQSLPLRVLVLSRYEPNLRSVLEAPSICSFIEQIDLAKDCYSSLDDVGRFITSQFELIKLHHPDIATDSDWPSTDYVDILVRRSSGNFLYASVVMRRIASEDQHPQTMLEEIISSPFEVANALVPLDKIYLHLLRRVPAHNRAKVKKILVSMVVSTPPANVTKTIRNFSFLDTLLDLKTGKSRMLLKNLASVVDIPNHLEELPSRFLHASFPQLLIEQNRLGDLAKDFWCNEQDVHAQMEEIWLAYYCRQLTNGCVGHQYDWFIAVFVSIVHHTTCPVDFDHPTYMTTTLKNVSRVPDMTSHISEVDVKI